jgi:hypothetical protein
MTVAPRLAAWTIDWDRAARLAAERSASDQFGGGLSSLKAALVWRMETISAPGATPMNPSVGAGALAMMPATRVP